MDNKNYYQKHKKKCREYQKLHLQDLKLKAYKILGNQCCNPFHLNHGDFVQDIRCLQIDHINGGGTKEHKRLHTRGIYFKIIQGDTKDYQLLCANCNWIKKVINEELSE